MVVIDFGDQVIPTAYQSAAICCGTNLSLGVTDTCSIMFMCLIWFLNDFERSSPFFDSQNDPDSQGVWKRKVCLEKTPILGDHKQLFALICGGSGTTWLGGMTGNPVPLRKKTWL